MVTFCLSSTYTCQIYISRNLLTKQNIQTEIKTIRQKYKKIILLQFLLIVSSQQ